MKLEHRFSVPAPVDTVWSALLDPQRVAPCFPGATLTSAGGDEFAGTVKVRLGPISLQYNGSGRFTETDPAAHRTVIEASGSASGGQSTAAATVVANLVEDGGGTVVTVATEMLITGRPAQFGRGLMEDVGQKIISQFAENLAGSLGPEESAQQGPVEPSAAAGPAVAAGPGAPTAAAAEPATSGRPERQVTTGAAVPVTDEIDLLDAAGGPVAKRLIPVAGALGLLVLVIAYWVRRRR